MNEQDLLTASIGFGYPFDDYRSPPNLSGYVTGSTAFFRPGDVAIVKLNLDYSGGNGTDIRYRREIQPMMMGNSFIGPFSYNNLALSADKVRLNGELWQEDAMGNQTFVTATHVDLHEIHA